MSSATQRSIAYIDNLRNLSNYYLANKVSIAFAKPKTPAHDFWLIFQIFQPQFKFHLEGDTNAVDFN